jgi:hypothetical protein
MTTDIDDPWADLIEPMTVPEVRKTLGMTSKGLNAWWSRHAGPTRHRMADGDEGVRYECAEVEAVLQPMLVLGSYNLRVKNAEKSLGWFGRHPEDPEKLKAADVKELLGVTQSILDDWRLGTKGPLRGPRAIRLKDRGPFLYRKSHIMEIRAALLALGRYELGLAECPRHLTADGNA